MTQSKKRFVVMVTLDEKTDSEVGEAAAREGLPKATWVKRIIHLALRDAA